MAQLVASMSSVMLGGVVKVVGSNLARGKIFTASIGSVVSLYIPPYIDGTHILKCFLRLWFWTGFTVLSNRYVSQYPGCTLGTQWMVNQGHVINV